MVPSGQTNHGNRMKDIPGVERIQESLVQCHPDNLLVRMAFMQLSGKWACRYLNSALLAQTAPQPLP